MKILTFTSLYPNPGRPRHGIFVENRLRHLREEGEIDLKVIAPVPSFPLAHLISQDHKSSRGILERETRQGIDVLHPKALIPPVGGMYLAPGALFRSGLSAARQLSAEGWDFDLVDAHYLYPDGVAAALIARALGKPLIVTARGTDVNVLMNMSWPRSRISRALDFADAVIAVSHSLKGKMEEHGVSSEKISVLGNGVDLGVFCRGPGIVLPFARDRGGPLLLVVGNLVPSKGVDLAIAATSKIEGARLLIVGDGPERRRLEGQVAANSMSDRVTFFGNAPHADIAGFYQAADLLVFPSEREGSPNVVIESLACGTPIVASRIAATEELLGDAPGVRLVERTPDAIASGIRELLADRPDPALISSYAEKFSWKETSVGLKKLMRTVIDEAGNA